MMCCILQAEQDVPEFLEQAAEKAYGSSYGPVGGQFGSTDTRVGLLYYAMIYHA